MCWPTMPGSGASVANTGSVAFHRRLGFAADRAEDYDGRGNPMIVLTRPLPFDF
jgi:hypothetical protein